MLLGPSNAQTNEQNAPHRLGANFDYNLTLSFNDGGTSNCPRNASNAGSSVTVSTKWRGPRSCLNLDEIFLSNSTSENNHTIPFAVYNRDHYSLETNYSTIVYHQYSTTSRWDDRNDTSEFADRYVQFYSDRDCQQGDDGTGGDVFPWYESSCRAEYACSQVEFNIRSFLVGPVTDEYSDGRCRLTAQYGAGSSVRPWLAAVVGVGAVVALFVGL
ncbi:uncharacterized protein LTR77_010081 [Saxophila tyrrhenica]|uniref:Uncharacterized protein n=1 Tax=Saxophila tyrrhenica TaxID=1690608 RepID=A0AAV9P0N5_9PEZI|nr:hypothetical protein LTR77_010081 [Saxophila tyrrhenica]